MADSSSQSAETSPRSGNHCQYWPPAKSTTRRMAKRKVGTALPTTITPEVQTSKREPWRTALATPRGMETA